MATKARTYAPKVAYLFGAGATHAELANLFSVEMANALFFDNQSLLLADVSKRVFREARRKRSLPTQIRSLISTKAISNIELFISLLEKNQVSSTEQVVGHLKALLQKDIESRLQEHSRDFHLYRGLLEFHKMCASERLLGLITLNYDRLLDDAYEDVFKGPPNYCLSMASADTSDTVPLLKLHGGFGLKYQTNDLPIITPGVNKNYLSLPYNFFWGRALEILLECDILRVVGCSLSQNDIGIVDLIFKAHLKRQNKATLVLQVIDFDGDTNPLKHQFGFFHGLQTATELEGGMLESEPIRDPTMGSNPFKIWLMRKIERAVDRKDIRGLGRAKYLRKILK